MISVLAFAVLSILAGAVQSQVAVSPSQNPTQPVTSNSRIPDPEFIIGLEDVLSINVWRDPELSVREVVVRPDGKISLPLAGDIRVNGMTVRQLQDAIAEKLKEFISAPVVTVFVVRISSQSVSIVGQVYKPGVYPIGAPMTVLELLARAGGVTIDAKTKKILILRKSEGKTVTFMFNYHDIIKGKNLNQNILLKSGDVVAVP